MSTSTAAAASAVLAVQALSMPWATLDPFLFCVHHDDKYPAGNASFGFDPAALRGRNIGSDFSGRDGWSMYHGEQGVPGFPGHPHKGFETITIVRKGRIDHSDSLGASARFGGGDVQWLTAGGGIVHSEMFPMLNATGSNHLELFQIWLNLPAKSKNVPPHFTMFWAESIPSLTLRDDAGKVTTHVSVIAGALEGASAPLAPPPHSWAADAGNDVAVWTIKIAPGASWTLPAAAHANTNRRLFFFSGRRLVVDTRTLEKPVACDLRASASVVLQNTGDTEVECLLLQGRAQNEPTVQHGPFVMNTHAEISQAMQDYRRTRFGGWPWPSDGPVHGSDPARFARFPDGREERPQQQ
ncbi:pirin domain-containing protein domain-containing protein [Capsaspora owczarzaki ATCC 30864]|uniref:Pirin domain-containing protein domain-containing protein n=1 Tax=Capsaspora owczarzaki (strain ATCC 30864) TaxID=595528 RepID=A0A0D2WV87_CAPO3|nr:pirin domain-containing protein domain-containing protein [Capsaspora owczarzaki ATCC 30864]KJE96043.1 pirin domain-containing protein domain-containing protein [Capsaspora owczarzaki ATCC 30864]|eukprot:XP_004345166.1 pirin domain-containing protein domain-containing protein [Capsaspora owczarzaki ATCC 30864]